LPLDKQQQRFAALERELVLRVRALDVKLRCGGRGRGAYRLDPVKIAAKARHGRELHLVQLELGRVRAALSLEHQSVRREHELTFERQFMLATRTELGERIYARLIEATHKRIREQEATDGKEATASAESPSTAQASAGAGRA
jgi:hypothetical protein